MCGRFTQTATSSELCELLEGLDLELDGLQPDYNVAPTQQIVAIINQPVLRAVRITWGVPAAWGQGLHINARAETLREKPTFSEAFRTRRCLIPAGGFYEWQRCGRERIPWYFHLRSAEQGYFAGIWFGAGDQRGAVIVTTEANELVRSVHDRMPVILPRAHCRAWLENTENPCRLR
ncbi:MAG: SOS response-associated peptidase, partial [Kiritimatiellae bacterium]|nr:SOS response-associated peptidase [Kiritimatiellia bacterium]